MTTKPALLGYQIISLPDCEVVEEFGEHDILCETYATEVFLKKYQNGGSSTVNLMVPVFEGDLDPDDGDIRFIGPHGKVIPEDMLNHHYARNATLVIKLQTNSGYQSREMHDISIDQWARISAILNEPQPELTKVKAPGPKR
jgi:hypothetical protein